MVLLSGLGANRASPQEQHSSSTAAALCPSQHYCILYCFLFAAFFIAFCFTILLTLDLHFFPCVPVLCQPDFSEYSWKVTVSPLHFLLHSFITFFKCSPRVRFIIYFDSWIGTIFIFVFDHGNRQQRRDRQTLLLTVAWFLHSKQDIISTNSRKNARNPISGPAPQVNQHQTMPCDLWEPPAVQLLGKNWDFK